MDYYTGQLTFKASYPGNIDKNISLTPGDSNAIKSFNAATQFKINLVFLSWDSDLLEGRVEGTLEAN